MNNNWVKDIHFERCPKCGAVYRGWALLNEENPENQKCGECGTELVIYDQPSEKIEESEESINKQSF